MRLEWATKIGSQEARTAQGYRITWSMLPDWGDWHNAYSPDGRCIEAGTKEACKAACERHWQQAQEGKGRTAVRA